MYGSEGVPAKLWESRTRAIWNESPWDLTRGAIVLIPVIVIASGLGINTFTALSLAFQAGFAVVGAMDLVVLQSSSVLVGFVAMAVLPRPDALASDTLGEPNAVYFARNVLAHFPTPILGWIYVLRQRLRLEYGLFGFNACAALLVFWRSYGDYESVYGTFTHLDEAVTFLIYMGTLLLLSVLARCFVQDRE